VAWLTGFFQKKRGDRRTGSKLLGSLSEAVLLAVLFLAGSVLLVTLISVKWLIPGAAVYVAGWPVWLTVLVLCTFIVLGGFGLVRALFMAGASTERRSAMVQTATNIDPLQQRSAAAGEYPAISHDPGLTDSPGVKLTYRLPANLQGRAWRVVIFTTGSALWNSISATMIVLTVQKHMAGNADWFLTLLTPPFALIGVWGLYVVFRQLLQHTSIGPTNVEISQLPLFPGGGYTAHLVQTGRMNLKVLELLLTCDEEATYQQGTDIRTERHQVFSKRLFVQKRFSVEPAAPLEETVLFEVPADAMHSFQSRHNAVIWRLVVRGVAEGWPPFERSFPLIVYPSPPDRSLTRQSPLDASRDRAARRRAARAADAAQPQNLHTPK